MRSRRRSSKICCHDVFVVRWLLIIYFRYAMKVLLAILVLALVSVYSIDPPLLSDTFRVAFDETFIVNKTAYKVNGQWFYDSTNNRERVDRVNGRYDLFCSSILPNVTTACTQLTVNNKRYIIFPQKRQCCYCCNSQKGCGILSKNWLDKADYLGTERLIDTNYDKWSKDGDFGYNHFWVTQDPKHIPRRLDENGEHLTDYLVNTFTNTTLDDSYFALPTYCGGNCPLTTICGKFQETQLVRE